MTYDITWEYEGEEHLLRLELGEDAKIIEHSIKHIASKGFGDTISKAINKVSGGKVKPCSGCKKRQEALNKLMPYKDKKNGN
jgi:hypothetical protein